MSAADDHEPVHSWFQLSYSSYLVLARSMLQSMPQEWQAKFVALIEEMQATLDVDDAPDYTVTAKSGNRFIRDPYRDYDRGRRVVPRRCICDGRDPGNGPDETCPTHRKPMKIEITDACELGSDD